MRVLQRKKVREKTSLSAAQIDRMEAAGDFPRRMRLSARRWGWVEDEIEAWLATKAAERGWKPAA